MSKGQGQWVIQYVGDFNTEMDCADALGFLQLQMDYLGGRMLPPVNQGGRDKWKVQGFFQDSQTDWLPDGCRRVFVLNSQRRMLGFLEQPSKV